MQGKVDVFYVNNFLYVEEKILQYIANHQPNFKDDVSYGINILKELLLSPVFWPSLGRFQYTYLVKMLIQIILQRGKKVKEKIFSLAMGFIQRHERLILMEEERFAEFKILLLFLLNVSPRDAIYSLS